MKVTRFPSRAAGPADRMSGFVSHLRANGLKLGVGETRDALAALEAVDATDVSQVRAALATLFAADPETWRKFDDLFDAYWFNAGRRREGGAGNEHVRMQSSSAAIWADRHGRDDRKDGIDECAPAPIEHATPDSGESEAEGVDGRLIATRTENLSRRDLRELVDEASVRRAEEVARRLGAAIRDRRSRRRKSALRGDSLDMRRIQRASISRGGVPLDLFHKARPDRPVRLVCLCDVSGSMTVYSRVFLAFLKGLACTGLGADAYLFHTRLVRVTDALRDRDTMRAAGRLSLMAEGFGGGTDIAGCLNAFYSGYGARALRGRTAVIVLSDGYCSAGSAGVGDALSRIRRRARRIIWLNPLLGWKDYSPVAAAIGQALPYLDAHLPANTLEALGALEGEFGKI